MVQWTSNWKAAQHNHPKTSQKRADHTQPAPRFGVWEHDADTSITHLPTQTGCRHLKSSDLFDRVSLLGFSLACTVSAQVFGFWCGMFMARDNPWSHGIIQSPQSHAGMHTHTDTHTVLQSVSVKTFMCISRWWVL